MDTYFRIRELRLAAGLTQIQLAARLELNSSSTVTWRPISGWRIWQRRCRIVSRTRNERRRAQRIKRDSVVFSACVLIVLGLPSLVR